MPESLPFAVNTIWTWAYWANQEETEVYGFTEQHASKIMEKNKQKTTTHSSKDFVLLHFVK